MSSDPRSFIHAANAELMAACKRGDAAAMAAAYTSDAWLLPPHSDMQRGTAAIRAFWQGIVDMGLRDVQLDTADVEAQGETLIEIGRYTLRAPTGAVVDIGKYVVIWKQERGGWRLYRDIWTTSQPPPQP
jgi:uncharacterized protein (TIGR02246 family)